MELDAIFRLMDRAEKSSFTKIEVQSGDLRLLLERGVAIPFMPLDTANPPLEAQQPDDRNVVRSPISGVFYLAKEPGAEPFVSTGCRVNKGDTLCIIEAMKTMNEIRAPRSGVVTGILAKDSATVTAGEALFMLGEGN